MANLGRNDYCFACGKDNPVGLHLNFNFEGDNYVARKVVPREYQSYDGVVHGGIVTTMLDEAMCNYVNYKYDITVMTGRLDVRYRNKTPTEQELTITAWQESQRQNVYSMKATITTADGTVTAEATAKVVATPE